MTFDIVGAGGGGSLPERGGRVLTRGAGRLGATPAGPHPEATNRVTSSQPCFRSVRVHVQTCEDRKLACG